MKKVKRIIIIILAMVLVGVGYMNSKDEPIILEFGMFADSNWEVESTNSYRIIDRAISHFESEHPGVKVHYISGILKEDYSEWCAQRLLTGKMPDVFMVLKDDFIQYTSLEVLKPLNELMEKDKDFRKEEFFSTALTIGKNEDKQYALPYEVVPTLLFVNKTLLEKENIEMPKKGWTWDELYKICKQITRDTNGDGIIDQFGIYNYGWLEMVYSNGTAIWNQDTSQLNFTSRQITEAIKFVRNLEELNGEIKVAQEDFNSGRVAFMPLTFAEYRTYKTYPYKIKKYDDFKWDCISFPAGPSGNNISEVDALLVGINRRTKHEELAWEFLKQLTYCKETQMDILSYSQGVSVLKEVTGSEEAADIIQRAMDVNEQVISRELLYQVIEEGITPSRSKMYDEMIGLADMEVTTILQENKDIESSMKIFQRRVNKYMG